MLLVEATKQDKYALCASSAIPAEFPLQTLAAFHPRFHPHVE